VYEPSYLLVKWCRHARVQFILKFRAPTVDRYCLIIVKLVATTRVSRLLEQDLLPVPRTWVHLYLLPATCAEDMSTSISVTCYLCRGHEYIYICYLLPAAEDMSTSISVTCYLCRGHEDIYICYLLPVPRTWVHLYLLPVPRTWGHPLFFALFCFVLFFICFVFLICLYDTVED
jgi:hypothetical protein